MKSIIDFIDAQLHLDSEEEELLEYGLKQFLKSFVGVVTATVIGIVMNIWAQSAAFMIGFIILRIYAGGYHAKSEKACALSSFLLMIFAFIFIKYPFCNGYYCLLLLITGMFLVFLLAPVENINRLLSEHEKSVFKARARYISIAIFAISIVFYLLGIDEWVRCGAMILFNVSVLLLMGKCLNIKLS